ncbi:sodium:glutamate symporter [Kosmotoga pacifica]|uniref:Sodium:glutamate symporter n=2 Tax=Kosmotoga pacifica TaxID=1330330 RepID=A0A0G2Z7G4_9BACT|nr:sodium:glutamate symporter [Kosmotoga pacifica]
MLLSFLLSISVLMKRLIPSLKRVFIPNSIIAGFLGILLGSDVLGLFSFDRDGLGKMIYHFLAIGFIAIALKGGNSKLTRSSLNTGFIITMSLTIQAIIGFSLSLLIHYFFSERTFPLMGLLLPLAYDQGPGQAFSIGHQWEALGFVGGGTAGLVMATFGFLWATVGGIVILNIYLLKNRTTKKGETREKTLEALVKDYEFSDIDGMTIQLLAVGVVYFVTFLFLKFLSGALANLGEAGETVSQILWGLHFVIGVLFAFAFRKGYDLIRRSEKYKTEYLNDFLLQRVGGLVFDYMVAASISAIPLKFFFDNMVPILVITMVGGLTTVAYTIWFCKKSYRHALIEHIVAIFGMETGTISTGMALLREVDTNFETGTAEDLVLGSGVALIFGLPLLGLINLPILGVRFGKPVYFFYTLGGFIIYLLIVFAFWTLSVKRTK